jgi:capsular exopolysaccharide synthesis family protein
MRTDGGRVRVLRRRWRVIGLVAVCAAAGTAGGLVYGLRSYEATTTLLAPAGSAASSTVSYDDLNYSDRLANTYTALGESSYLRSQVERILPAAKDVAVSVAPQANTEYVDVQATAPQPELARRAADLWARTLITDVRAELDARRQRARSSLQTALAGIEGQARTARAQLERTRPGPAQAQLQEQIRILELRYQTLAQQAAQVESTQSAAGGLSIAFPATRPAAPSMSAAAKTAGLGLLLGLLAGGGVALVLERRGPRLETLDEIEEAAGASVLGTVPLVAAIDGAGNGNGGLPPAVLNGSSGAQDAFGRLRAQLLSRTRDVPCTVLVASAADGDGKSLVAVNLAAALARSRRTVVLVDGDLRRPSLHATFGVANDRGMGDLLESDAIHGADPADHVVGTPVARLDLLPAGPPSGEAAEMVGSVRTREVIEALEQRYEFVVVDSPALTRSGDATAYAAIADVVVLVIGRTPVPDAVVRGARRYFDSKVTADIALVVNRWPKRSTRERLER